MWLYCLEVKNYRSLEDVKLDHLQQFNVLIGQNNAGKSAVFGALQGLNAALTRSAMLLDVITGRDTTRRLEINLLFKFRPQEREAFVDMLIAAGLDASRRTAILDSSLLGEIQFVFKAPGYNPQLLHLRETKLLAEDGTWAVIQRMEGDERVGNPQYTFVHIGSVSQQAVEKPLAAALLDIDQGHHNNNAQVSPADISGAWASDPVTTWIFQRLGAFFSHAFFFSAFRHSESALPVMGTPSLSQNGSNLAQVLHTLASNDRDKFDQIEHFVHAALPDIGRLHASISNTSTSVAFRTLKGYLVYLHEMGGGIEQLLMVAYVLLTGSTENTLFLEEPESHLHAGAQRFLLEKLLGGGQQVFITTHSSVFINLTRPYSLYQVTYSEGVTAIKRCDAASLEAVLEDIGVRNSDVLLSDAVLFVEGTSDRDVFIEFSEKLGRNLFERNINVVSMGGGSHAPIRSDLLRDISQKAPVRHLFLLDRDERRQSDIYSLEERLGSNVYFLNAREVENYLLVPHAIRSALMGKHCYDQSILSRIEATTEEQIEQWIRDAANNLYSLVLLKRIRTEIGGLREGILPSETLPILQPDAMSPDLPKLIEQQVTTHFNQRVAGLNVQ